MINVFLFVIFLVTNSTIFSKENHNEKKNAFLKNIFITGEKIHSDKLGVI